MPNPSAYTLRDVLDVDIVIDRIHEAGIPAKMLACANNAYPAEYGDAEQCVAIDDDGHEVWVVGLLSGNERLIVRAP